MSDKIKPSEVSQVLLDQLKGISNAEKFDEVGTVLTVSTLPTSSNFSALVMPLSWSSRTWDTSLGLILSDICFYLFTFLPFYFFKVLRIELSLDLTLASIR